MEKMYKVTNRSSSLVWYSVPEVSANRRLAPGEVIEISEEELKRLNYQEGGASLIKNYFLIEDAELREKLIGDVEPEYNLTADEIKTLILVDPIDKFLDCLDFAPDGVIELIKKLAVELPITDARKVEGLKNKTGFDAFTAIKNNNLDKAEAGEETQKKERRVKTETKTSTGRRYNIIEE